MDTGDENTGQSLLTRALGPESYFWPEEEAIHSSLPRRFSIGNYLTLIPGFLM